MLKSLRNRVRRENEPRVLIVGLDNAGKTTLLNALGENDVPEAEKAHSTPAAPEGPTHGFNMKTLTRAGRKAKLCDLGGQRALREYWQDYYNNTDCIMYVVDSSDHRRLEETYASFVDVLNGIQGVPVLVLANKQDLATAKSPQVIAETLHLQEFRDRKWHIQGCSAKTGMGLEEGVTWILSTCTS
ncbi:ADP-ribosylation factor-like protein [Trypanosoma conorhini]|uniref:ADP-ribosylation factor-like protein n=1 Tax=Trypanosoma conorhini TaxID=83891 RepID=A0A3R7M4K0_9TRYP|nr:ADP-ribosylation factor-like protein [Trypanosoma conorhini]RNF26416.1 ADP-ribosylation factor-like protein [Trypanosoma conorhini]